MQARTRQHLTTYAMFCSIPLMAQPTTPAQWISKAMAAGLLGVSVRTITRWAAEGKLVSRKMSASKQGIVRISYASIERMMQ